MYATMVVILKWPTVLEGKTKKIEGRRTEGGCVGRECGEVPALGKALTHGPGHLGAAPAAAVSLRPRTALPLLSLQCPPQGSRVFTSGGLRATTRNDQPLPGQRGCSGLGGDTADAPL